MAKSFIRNPGQTNLVRVGVGREGIFKLESKMDKVGGAYLFPLVTSEMLCSSPVSNNVLCKFCQVSAVVAVQTIMDIPTDVDHLVI